MVKPFYTLVDWMLGLVSLAMTLLIVLTIFGLLQGYVSGINSYDYLVKILGFEQDINQFIKANIPTQLVGRDASRIITIIIAFVLGDVTRNLQIKWSLRMQRHAITEELMRLQNGYRTSKNDAKVSLINSKIEAIKFSKARDRQTLLSDFVAIKRELEKGGRELAFLAVDVVNSAGMKEGEDPSNVEHDFAEYRKLIESKINANHVIKCTWTGDGIMACFNSIDDAVRAAQDILRALPYFNGEVKTLKTDFSVRCGINSGFLYFDESVPLEKMSDRVIDIAAHMQKSATPNTIFIAKQIVTPVPNDGEFEPNKRLVDGLEVWEWTKKK